MNKGSCLRCRWSDEKGYRKKKIAHGFNGLDTDLHWDAQSDFLNFIHKIRVQFVKSVG